MNVAIDRGPLESAHAVRGVGVYTRELIKALKRIKGLNVNDVDFTKTNLTEYDVIHYPYFHPFFLTLPAFSKASDGKPSKIVVTIHDLIQLIYPDKYKSGFK